MQLMLSEFVCQLIDTPLTDTQENQRLPVFNLPENDGWSSESSSDDISVKQGWNSESDSDNSNEN